jgi:hypothetical protein
MPKRMAWLILLVLLLVGCAQDTDTRPAPFPAPTVHSESVGLGDQAVLQIVQGGGMVVYFEAAKRVPEVTLWGDGRVVFVAPDGVIREARLEPATVDYLVDAATVLYDLADHYTAFLVSDAPSTLFSVETVRGRKTVRVYALNLEKAMPREQEPETMEKLRTLYKTVIKALPEQAPMMQPDEVVVETGPVPEDAVATEAWPAEWVGHLKGKPARGAVRRLGVGPAGLFRWNGEVHQVTIIPVLPLLHLPWSNWPRGGLPRHPAATAYNVPGTPYRFAGVSQAEVAAWYQESMRARGWQLATAEDAARQVWVRERFFNDPIVEIHFESDHFSSQFVSVEDGIPRHPDGVLAGRSCESLDCQWVQRATPGEAAAWFRTYLGYLGWREEAPNVFRKGFEQVRLRYQAGEEGTTVRFERGQAMAPPEGWPAPPPEERLPLCEVTRGKEVEIAGQRIQLHESLCVTAKEPDRLRIQVAYGRSYVEVDPETGRQIGGSLAWEEANLFIHLEPIVGQRLPKAPPQPTPTP